MSGRNFIYDGKMMFYLKNAHHRCNVCENKGTYYCISEIHVNSILEGTVIGGECYKEDKEKDRVHIFIDPDFERFLSEKLISYVEQIATDELITIDEFSLKNPVVVHYINLLVKHDIVRELYINYLNCTETLKDNIVMSDINRATLLIECETLFKPSEMGNDFYFVSVVTDLSQLIKKGLFSVNEDLKDHQLISKLSIPGDSSVFGAPVCYFAIYKFKPTTTVAVVIPEISSKATPMQKQPAVTQIRLNEILHESVL